MWNAYCERRMDMRRRTMAEIGLMVIVCLVFLCGSVELQMTETEIQWRRSDGEWKKLVGIEDTAGPSVAF